MNRRYLDPPKDLKIEDYIPFIRYLLAGAMVMGGVLTVVAIIYLAVSLIKAIYGASQLKKKNISIAIWGLIIGVMLLGGGWLGWINFIRAAVDPSKIL